MAETKSAVGAEYFVTPGGMQWSPGIRWNSEENALAGSWQKGRVAVGGILHVDGMKTRRDASRLYNGYGCFVAGRDWMCLLALV